MSTTGNRSNPNQVRTSGHAKDAPASGGTVAPDTRANQESRDHNKHNHSGQDGHKPQRHGPAEEKR
jgi:hypothetical protein